MLELQKWLFKLRNPHYEMKWPHWDILDPIADQQVGVIKMNRSGHSRRTRWWNGSFEARSVPEDTLIFSSFSPIRLGRGRREIRDAGDELIGYFQRKWFSIKGGYWIYDSRNQPLGEVRADWSRYEFSLLDSQGREVGKLSRKLVGMSRGVLFDERDYLVTAGDAADKPEMKTLLLATVLAASSLPA